MHTRPSLSLTPPNAKRVTSSGTFLSWNAFLQSFIVLQAHLLLMIEVNFSFRNYINYLVGMQTA